MRYLKKKIENNLIELICLSDWHAGSKNFDEKLAKEYIKYLNTTQNAYVILVGDLTNCALKNSKSDVYTSMSPAEEIDYVCSDKLLGSVDRRKFVLSVSGNHGNRALRETSIGIDRLIASRLGIEDTYTQFLGLVNIKLPQNSFFVTVHHGAGGGGTYGAKANNMDKLATLISGADIAVVGHSHSPLYFPRSQMSIDKKHEKIITTTTHVVNSGSLHTYDESYAEEKMMKPSMISQAIITITDCPHSVPKKIGVRYHI